MRKLVYLSLGSNLGDREANLKDAILRLGALGKVVAISSFYETEPVEFAQQPWFLNCAVSIEQEMGRKRQANRLKGPRSIDIDVLLFGTSVVDTQTLTVPHPAMHRRRFVLEPLAEIAPEHRHPIFKRTIRELRDALPPGPAVRRLARRNP